MKGYLSLLRNLYDTGSMSATTRDILEQEEINGAVMSNRFRYVFIVFLLSVYIFNNLNIITTGSLEGLVVNTVALALYLAVALVYSAVFRWGSEKYIIAYSYLAVIFDFLIITYLIVRWTQLVSPENFAYQLKNPILILYLLPIAITVFQFRIRLVALSITLFIILYFSFVVYGLVVGIPVTSSWYEYVMGDKVVIADMVTMKPAVFLCVGAAIGYAIYRSYRMMIRIGNIEAQRRSLSRYFSPAVRDEIVRNPDTLTRGKRQKAAVLFCDIRDFTSMSEAMDPDEVYEFLSEFRERLTNAIFEFGGTIDKYIGDAIMAVFGAPNPFPVEGDDCRNAVHASFRMLELLEDLNRRREEAGEEPIRIGIGIHAGDLFAGNIGYGQSDRPVEYTVIGDVVNTASRIEGLCKRFQAEFLISDDVYREVQRLVRVLRVPKVVVKGKDEPLQLYKVIELREESK